MPILKLLEAEADVVSQVNWSEKKSEALWSILADSVLDNVDCTSDSI